MLDCKRVVPCCLINVKYTMKLQFVFSVVVAASLVACHSSKPVAVSTAPTPAAVPAIPVGLAPVSVAGKTIFVSAEAYVFDAGGNSYPNETGTVTYIKTGANTARIIDTFAGDTVDIIFTSPTKGRSSLGDVVTME